MSAAKHTLNRGQNRGKQRQEVPIVKNEENEEIEFDDREYDVVASNAMNVSNRLIEQKVLVVQPYIKWGPRKSAVKPEHMHQEADALVRSIPSWSIVDSVRVGLESLDKKTLFGSGKLEELRGLISELKTTKDRVSIVFISKSMLARTQKILLEGVFGCPVVDRYSVVIQILRLHATSAEAKLQVAMAEIPYIWQQMRDLDSASVTRGQIFFTDSQKEMLKHRERKIKDELERIRAQRVMLRKKRTKKSFPIVAVVGYTNAGKTSLIKALTDEESLQPKDQLFATLDVTSHAGRLPCRLSVLFMDTVGFMSDIPTGLIECFVATLEDAMLADVILHVQDIAHENCAAQKRHVEETLQKLMGQIEGDEVLPPVINVGNKVDLYDGPPLNELELVSSKTLSGINDLLIKIEEAVLQATQRQKIIVKVRMGGEEASWLYKNAAVTDTEADPKSSEHLLMHVVISEPILQQFRHRFIKSPSR